MCGARCRELHPVVVLPKGLNRELTVDDGDDDMAGARRDGAVDNQHVAVGDADIAHRLAHHLHPEG